MEKKKFKIEWIIIVILSVCLIGTCGFILYDKFIKEGTPIVDEKNDQNKEIEITPEIEKKVIADVANLEGYAKRISVRNTNIFADAKTRADYVIHIIQEVEKSCMWTSGESMQETPYVLYDDYKQKYSDIYGDLYSLEDDLKQSVGLSALSPRTDCATFNPEISKDGSYVCWMGTRGITGEMVKLTLNDKTLNGNIYTLTGTYNVSIVETLENGIFEIKYVIKNDDAYLSSFIMNTSK